MTMLNLKTVAQWLSDATVWGDEQVCFERVCTDSRQARAGDLFVALRGERFDAHQFLSQMIACPVSALLVERVPENCALPAIQVPNTRRALAQLAKGWRQRFNLPVVVVAGSNGKTTVKEMLAAIFTTYVGEKQCLVSQGNFNNEIGLPLSVLRLNSAHQFAVFEVGMNHAGETEQLIEVACPNIALINNAQREHQEFMFTVEAVALEHASAIHGLSADGVAVFPATDEYQSIWRLAATGLKVIDFALWNDEQQTQAAVTGVMKEQCLAVNTAQGTCNIHLKVLGQHNGHNALAAIAVAIAANVSLQVIQSALEKFEAVAGRLQTQQVQYAPLFGATVIDDSYNANPDSVRAAIDVLASYPQVKIFVLGDMGEVGENGTDFHREVGLYAQTKKIDYVLTMGEMAKITAQVFGQQGFYASTVDALIAQIQQLPVNANSVFLIKGSRFMKMEQIVSFLTAYQSSTALSSEKH